MFRLILLCSLMFASLTSLADDKNAVSPSLPDTKSQLTTVTDKDYVLGTGDLIKITVYGNQDMTTEARISAAGTITFPLLGEIKIGELSASNAEKKIAAALIKGGYVKQPNVNLVVEQFQSQFISVLGDVYKPGRYPMDRPATLFDALSLAGGATVNGSDMVTLIRTTDGKTSKKEYDLRELRSNADSESNPKIQADDIVFVNGREVSVLGQVNRPGKYSVVSGVRTVLDFLSQAGGISPSGADKIIVVTNRDGETKKIELDVDQLYRSGDIGQNFELSSGDSIYVPRSPVFYIYGEVQRPGSFRLERNMTVAQALSTGGGLTSKGTERGMKIKRMNQNKKLKIIDARPNDLLQADDVIEVSESLF